MLSTCYAADMPYRDPHTAAPTLWALRDRDGADFEVSTSVRDSAKVERLALEAVAITLHRLHHGASPLANFGGQITGYRVSSANNSALVAAGKRFRGGRDAAIQASASCPVPGPLDGDVDAANWLGLEWSAWMPIDDVCHSTTTGMYRLRRPGADHLLYVGQGRVSDRIRAHRAKRHIEGHRQAAHFGGDVEASWAALNVCARALLEIENDTIASHRLTCGSAPIAQFLG
ncbi:MAG: hypothetical protein ACKO27_07790 [Ilumatobacteraceae bacterium]